jgi:hypothetical protein
VTTPARTERFAGLKTSAVPDVNSLTENHATEAKPRQKRAIFVAGFPAGPIEGVIETLPQLKIP